MARIKTTDLVERVRSLSSPRYDRTGFTRLVRAAGLLMLVFLSGTVGYYIIGGGEYTLLTCAYMTVITLTSVGFGEVIPISDFPERVVFTIVLLVLGMGMALYFVSQLTAFIVDGELRDIIFFNRMRRQILKIENHFIIAGVGSTGLYVLQEVIQSGRTCLVIDQRAEWLDEMSEQILERYGVQVPFIVGDATEDSVLREAGIERAVGIVFALGNDRDNLFATISARSLSPTTRIVTRGENPQSKQKFERAGATSTIFTNALGGLRMAAEVIRPEVTGFLDLMMSDHGEVRRIEELEIKEESPIVGKTLREANLRQHTDALIVAVYDQASAEYTFNPGPDCTLSAHTKLIVLTLVKDVPKLEAILSGGRDLTY